MLPRVKDAPFVATNVALAGSDLSINKSEGNGALKALDDAETRVVRGKALLEETIARRSRTQAQLDALDHPKAAPPASTTAPPPDGKRPAAGTSAPPKSEPRE